MKKILSLLIVLQIIYANNSFTSFKVPFFSNSASLSNNISCVNNGSANNFTNPSLLNYIKNNEISINYQKLYQDMFSYQLGYGTKLGDIAYSLNIMNTKISDIEIRKRPGDPEGEFSYNVIVTNVGLAYKLNGNISLGAAFNYANQQILVDDESAYFVNFGLFYKNLIDNLDYGFSINNLGSTNGLRNSKSELPVSFSTGFLYNIRKFNAEKIDLNLLYELEKIKNESLIKNKIAFEAKYDNLINLRMGYIFNNDVYNFTFGLGLMFNNYELNYSYLPVKYSLGDNHSIGIKINW